MAQKHGRGARLSRLWQALGIPADYLEQRHLPRQREARGVVIVGRNREGRAVRLTPRAAAAWRRMRCASAQRGVRLQLISGFRSVRRQARLIRDHLAGGRKIGAVLRFMAAPGCSEHHTGRALDLGSPAAPDLSARFARTREFRWLRRNAARFGFHLSYPRGNRHRLGYEPWHWRWDARAAPRGRRRGRAA
jgi:D-alanyl-D-alanine carboxypeptidase